MRHIRFIALAWGLLAGLLACPAMGAVGDTRIATWQGDKKAVFLLMFDDGWPSHYQMALPALTARNMVATFYINPAKGEYKRYKKQWEEEMWKAGATGTYSVRVHDRQDSNTGPYSLGVVFGTPKCAAIPLACGQVLTNVITDPVQQHTYTFAGLAGEAQRDQLGRWRRLTPAQAPVNSPQEFLVFCGVLVLGWAVTAAAEPGQAEARRAALQELRAFASDPRWRTREAVAMALQHWGAADLAGMLAEMGAWAGGDPFEQRAVVAAICEPAVLVKVERMGDPDAVQGTIFTILDHITADFSAVPGPESPEGDAGRRSAGFQALKKGLAYSWSVAVAYLPEQGRLRLERWFASSDPDLRWVMRENLKKARLERMDPDWVAYWKSKV